MTSKLPLMRVMLAMGLIAALASGPAEARRGGSFGSRGSHTYYAPPSTSLSTGYTPPVSRTMTARPAYQAPQYAPSYGSAAPQFGGYRPHFGFGGGLLTGLVTGGLIGSLFGHHGFGGGYGDYGGGGGGMLPFLIQIAVLGGLAWLAFRLFRGGGAGSPPVQPFGRASAPGAPYTAPQSFAAAPVPDDQIALGASDQDAFERLLIELQDAFGHEDYARLRTITTPEIMSYLAEELSDNATHGRRNEVTGTRLLDGEISEAWREDDADYATIAMRYESIDVMRDRTTNAVLSGDPLHPSETTELWTFVRPSGAWSGWKVSAIQEA